jgi:hypothetical protein
MSLVINPSSALLWQDVVKYAQDRCAVSLKDELQAYLVSLLMRYTNKPEVVEKVLAIAYLDAMQARERQRQVSLMHVGDQCLIVAGLFPHLAEKRHVKISYFVDIGRTAYSTVSATAHDLYWSLAYQFVGLMDVLQSIRPYSDLLPLEAYEQWNELGSQRALQILQQYAKGMPIKHLKR